MPEFEVLSRNKSMPTRAGRDDPGASDAGVLIYSCEDVAAIHFGFASSRPPGSRRIRIDLASQAEGRI